jgi:hypothetical protein
MGQVEDKAIGEETERSWQGGDPEEQGNRRRGGG